MSLLILKRTGAFDPSSGFDTADEHFSAFWEGYRVGSVYWLAGDWVWAIEIVGIGGVSHGNCQTFSAAETALNTRWYEREATLGIDYIMRAIGLAHHVDGKPPVHS